MKVVLPDGSALELPDGASGLDAAGRLAAAGGKPRLAKLAKLAPATSNAGHHARLVLDAAERRGAFTLAAELCEASLNGGLASSFEHTAGTSR